MSITVRNIMGRRLDFPNGYLRRHIELERHMRQYTIKQCIDINFLYDYYEQPKSKLNHFIKRVIKYPLHLRKTDKDVLNYIIVQHLSDLALILKSDDFIICCHDIWNFLDETGYQNSSIVNKYRLKGMKKCNNLIAISEFTKNEMIEKLGLDEDKITVIRNGVNRNVFYPIKNIKNWKDFWSKIFHLGEKNILYVGTESGRKDFPTLLKAFNIIKEMDKNIKIVRVGKPEFEKEIKDLGLENDIIYLSNIQNNVLNILYNVCDVFVFPSLYEGYGLPAMEANSAGCPLICSDIPVFRELYDKSALFFEPQNYKMLSHMILDVLCSEPIQTFSKKQGIKNSEENKWEKFSKQFYNYIKEVSE